MNGDQNHWLVSDLEDDERAQTRPPISEKTEIVRYVRLSTFLLYLTNRAFIPSLRLLQSMDPLECRLPEKVFEPGYGTRLESLLRPHEPWLVNQARGAKPVLESDKPRTRVELNFLAKVWLAELAKRRCVWCWNIYQGESNAMWSLYGSKGVAVVSTVGRVKAAIEKAGPFRCLIAPVRYPIARRMFLEGENPEPTTRMMQGSNLIRPYLFKNPTFRYEEEIRFVFGTHPDLVQEGSTYAAPSPRGIMIQIDREILPEGFHASPEIPIDEFQIIGPLFQGVIGKNIAFPDYPAPKAQEWNSLAY
jgi:hypothetical protein